MVCVKLGGVVYDVKEMDDVCEGLCWVLCEDVVNSGLKDWGGGGDRGWNISMARVCRRYGRVTIDRSSQVTWWAARLKV